MNHLAHLYLANYSETSLAGNLLGDWIKGPIDPGLPAKIALGVRLHRTIDSYTDSHPRLHAALARFEPPYRRYAGILLDIYFDYLLANRWRQYHAHDLPAFAHDAARRLQREWPHAPFTAARMQRLPRILIGYRRLEGVQAALTHVGGRLKRDNPVALSMPVLQAQHDELVQDFEVFFPSLVAHVTKQARQLRTFTAE